MSETAEYVAQHRINAPGSYAGGYQQGDRVAADVVQSWGLNVPDDVVPADGYQPPRPADDNPDRAAWEAYVVGQGADLDSARAASLAELRDMYEAPPEPDPPAHDLPAGVAAEGVDGTGYQNATPVTADNTPSPAQPVSYDVERPAESAKKDDWVSYVVASDPNAGGWARDSNTTKADLIAWTPGGDR